MFGNPHEIAAPAYVDILRRGIEPVDKTSYAYAMNDPAAQSAIASGLRERFGMAFEAEDVFLTNGNFTGLAICVRILADQGDEVVFVSPPWFFYETLIVGAGATPVRVLADRETWDLDLDAIEAAVTPRTRAIIVNSPNNPTGKIYEPSTLDRLASILTAAGERNGRPIYLLSDEAYNRIVFDAREYPTPAAHYPWSFYIYTYGKTHLAPGNRVGYVALSPSMPGREELRPVMMLAQITFGWGFPVAPLQRAIPELDRYTIDLARLQARRDRLVPALREQGYDAVSPEGTFYVLVRSPLEDDQAFHELLAKRDVFVLPGHVFEMPGFFRLSLTANDDMVERAIPGFAAAIAEARGR
jgi:aspartate aminotransferase